MVARITNISACIPLIAVVLGVLAFTGSPAPASILVPGGPAVSTPGTATLVGLTLKATETIPFIGTDVFGDDVFGGNLISSVYSDPGTGGLDFTYQIDAAAGYSDTIHGATVDYYVGFSTDVDYVKNSGDAGAFATAALSSNGGYISLDYPASAGDGIAPGIQATSS